MVTQCTACLVWFRVTREQLHAAHGLVRCSACNTVFNALASLRHEMPEGGVPAGGTPAASERTGDDSSASMPAGSETPESDDAQDVEQADDGPRDAMGGAGPPGDEAPAADDSAPAPAEAYLGIPGNAPEPERMLEPEPEQAAGFEPASGPETDPSDMPDAPTPGNISELEFYLASALEDEYIGPLPDYTRVQVKNVEPGTSSPFPDAEPEGRGNGVEPEPGADGGFADQALDDGGAEIDATPAFAVARGNRWSRRAWGLVLVVAALALAGQIVYAQRDELGRIFGLPRSEPVLHRYAISGATLDAAEQQGALVLKGTLVNQGARAQRLPLIRVTLTDRYGDTVGARILSPRQYGAGRKSLLHAHQHFMFHVKLADPGSSAVGFSLVLCKHHGHSILCQDS